MSMKCHQFKSANENFLIPFEHNIYQKVDNELATIPLHPRSKRALNAKQYNDFMKDGYDISMPNRHKKLYKVSLEKQNIKKNSQESAGEYDSYMSSESEAQADQKTGATSDDQIDSKSKVKKEKEELELESGEDEESEKES